ncbi:uncharacterized protein LOC141617456 [Silene latifolia]|uniref:uncharacterized protein LOC141617456 n=1 Tax=Silene latifolia TaxID=37657 RepID=UPI003D777BE0
MNFGFWNVREMNKEVKQRSVNNFLHTNNIGLFGLLETKVKASNFHSIVNKIFSDWSVSTNNAYHHGGRVWVIWKPHVFDVNFIKYDAQFIHVQVTNKFTHMQFYYTIIYAFNGVGERESLWLNLKNMARKINAPWAIGGGGDFNCVLQANERLGGNVTEAEAEPFYDCIQECGVMDISATSAFYTWNNKQPPETRVYSRLDRMVVNQEWLDQFPEYMANFLPKGHFDHNPCLLSKGSMGGNQHKPFKYFNMWSAADGFQECVSKVWQHWVSGNKMYRVVKKLKMLKTVLKRINKDHFSNIEKAADIAQLRLKQLQEEIIANPGDMGLVQQEYEAHHKFNSLNHSDQEGIQNGFLNNYAMLLGSKTTTTKVNKIIVKQGNICTTAHRSILLSPVTKDEVKEVLFHIPDDKAPGPDRYSSKFFKDSWDIVGEDVTNAILNFFESGLILK